MVQILIAKAYGWIGGTLFERGKRTAARRFLLESLAYQLWQPRTLIILGRATMPQRLDTLARKGYRWIKRLIKPMSSEIKV
jgi:hypothetical protein